MDNEEAKKKERIIAEGTKQIIEQQKDKPIQKQLNMIYAWIAEQNYRNSMSLLIF